MDNLINKKLDGRYLIEELLGTGGMANVYRGRDLQENRAIAVKVLREEFLTNADLVRRFKNESKAISVLNHPNIVKVYDISVSEKLQYIVMEHIDGITLKEYMEYRAQPLTYKETLHFVTQTLKALQHAHEKGIVHRDIKPQNIMLLGNGNIKVMDFGIARFSRSENQTMTDKAIGSVHYISPEQAKGDTTDAKADIYSVGVMMYEMLSGVLPFESDSPVLVAIKQISDTPTPIRQLNANVPEALASITNRAMAKETINRYSSARLMLADLEEFQRNPNVKFDYQSFEDTEPTKYVDKVVSKTAAPKQTAQRGRPATKNVKNTARKPVPKKKKRKLMIPILAGVSAAFAIGSLILIYFIFKTSGSSLFSQYEDVALPNFTNMSIEDIQNDPAYALFRFEIEESYNTDHAAGVVYDQSPKTPKLVKENARVVLRVSRGTQVVMIPSLENMTKEEAQKALRDLGLSVTIKTQENTEIAPGIVLSMEPQAGESVETGQVITLYVSREHIENQAQVPSVIGMDINSARTILEAKKFNLGTQTEVENSAPAGTIIMQTPQAGQDSYLGDSVHVTISTGIVSATRSVTIVFTDTNDGGTYSVNVNGNIQSVSGEAGVASFAVLSFTDSGTIPATLYDGNGTAIQSAYLDFTPAGGDITFTVTGNTPPAGTVPPSSPSTPSSHVHDAAALDAAGNPVCSICGLP